jgi:tripartite-type tricarboxylate transporter receptor subunit TctC
MKRFSAAVLFLFCANALGQAFPSKPVRVIVPFPPGGGTDIVARTVTPKMAELLGQPFVVENRAGAGGNIGTEAVAKSPADGHTLLMASASTAINTTLVPNLSWDFARDFAPVVLLVVNNHLLAAHPSVPASNVRELLALAKAKPGQVTYASYGPGSSAHLTAELFKLMAGVDLLHVPYKGAAPAVNDLLGGQVNIVFADVAALLSHIKSGKLKALATGGDKRNPVLPNVPTVAEAGVPSYRAVNWWGIMAPAGTPPAVVAEVHQALTQVQNTPAVKEQFVREGADVVQMSTEEFGKFIQTEMTKWQRVVKEGNIKAQ